MRLPPHECVIVPWVAAPGEYYSAGIRHVRCEECGQWWSCTAPGHPWARELTTQEAVEKFAATREKDIARVETYHATMGYPPEWTAAFRWLIGQPAGTVFDGGAGMRDLTLTGTLCVLTGEATPHHWVNLANVMYKRDFMAAAMAKL